MDPELRAYLDAMRTEAAVRDAQTRQQMDARFAEAAARDAETHKTMDGMRAEMDSRFAEARQQMESKINEVRRQAGADRDAIIAEIKALPEAFSTHQRAEADRLDAAREEDMLNHHVLPLEASAANHEKRIAAVEKKVRR